MTSFTCRSLVQWAGFQEATTPITSSPVVLLCSCHELIGLRETVLIKVRVFSVGRPETMGRAEDGFLFVGQQQPYLSYCQDN